MLAKGVMFEGGHRKVYFIRNQTNPITFPNKVNGLPFMYISHSFIETNPMNDKQQES